MTRVLWLQPAPGGAGRNDLLTLALSGSASCILFQDKDWSYQLIANLPDCWQPGLAADISDIGLFGTEIADKLADLKRNLESTGAERTLEIEVDEQVFLFTISRVGDPAGQYFYQTRIEDVTKIRNFEQKLTSLQREGSHRSKNMLAVIQSIASQTARHSATLQEFLKKFRDRVHSLSQSQDLITGSRWEGARFFDLVHQQTKRMPAENRRLIQVEGDNVLLSPNASLHLGLALHELLMNAANHGTVFECRDTVITVSCERVQSEESEAIRFRWREPFNVNWKSITTRSQSYGKHFGSTVLEHVVPASVAGEAEYSLGSDEITYALTFPLEQHA
jgi:two-component sensor histidine kinase